MDKIGSVIKALRQQKQWTQRELAQKFEPPINPTVISRWERDVVQPSAKTRKQLSSIFKAGIKKFYP